MVQERILNVKWTDIITNDKVFQREKVKTLFQKFLKIDATDG
jgi:hypothetical protein